MRLTPPASKRVPHGRHTAESLTTTKLESQYPAAAARAIKAEWSPRGTPLGAAAHPAPNRNPIQ